MRNCYKLIFAVLLMLLWSSVSAQFSGIQLDVKKHVLSNGMRILVLENHTAPVFSTVVRFNVGSVDERPGITGSSHLLEHMRFKGTKIFGTTNYEAEAPILAKIDSLAHLMRDEQVKLLTPLNPQDSTRYKALRQQIADLQVEEKKYIVKDEFYDMYQQNGGTGINAGTGQDETQFIASLPSNRLEFWAFVESDRLANPVFREFYSERDVVMEERRMSVENSPRGVLEEALLATVNWGSSYKWDVIGWMSDLQTVPREEVEAYYKTYYSPSNAVAVIVGDVKAEEVFSLCEKYFGKIPSRALPPPVVTRDAPQRGERRVEIEYDASPIASICWHVPAIGDPDLPALDLASSILSGGRTSRFFKNIRQKRIGQASASVSINSRIPDVFSCNIQPYGDHTLQEVEDSVYSEIEKLKTEKVTDWELEKVKNQSDSYLIRSLESGRGLTSNLSTGEILAGDWRYFLNYQDALRKVTADDIMRVVNKYLTKSNRTVVSLVKPYVQTTPASGQNN
jgi:predicted Zn-dependent peptidase